MSLNITTSDQACGAEITGIDLKKDLSESKIFEIREHWLKHHVLSFPNQALSDDDLERFTLCFGSFGDDPFIASIPGRKNIIAVKRTAAEKVPIFADNWHTDWSFQENPPAGTCLFGKVIPSEGGDTLFANQHLAKINNFTPKHFSFNTNGGRCESCKGLGFINIEMQFLSDIQLTCETCHGKRYKDDILNIHFKNKNISDILDLNVQEGYNFFLTENEIKISNQMQPLIDVGLGLSLIHI